MPLRAQHGNLLKKLGKKIGDSPQFFMVRWLRKLGTVPNFSVPNFFGVIRIFS